jgi:PKD repeat protein
VNFGNDTVLCPGVTKTLNAGNTGATYLWNTSATTQSITVSAAGTYSVLVTNTQKCVGRDTINIYNDVNPVVNLGPDTAICPGKTITLDAGNSGSTYLYSTGATTRTIGVTSGGTYSVRVTNVNKCVGRDTIVIAQGVNPIVNLGNDTAACNGIAITLDAGNPGSTYLYSTGANTQTLSVTPGGTYWVLVTNAQKCQVRDTIVVSILPKASVSVINQSKTATTVTFSSDAANTTIYTWDFGDGATANIPSPSHTYTINGTYTVRLIVTNECGSDTAITSVTISGVGVGTVTAAPAELKLYPNPAHGFRNAGKPKQSADPVLYDSEHNRSCGYAARQDRKPQGTT